jgi:hypothetical protein
MSSSGNQDVLQELYGLVAEVETYDFFEIPNLKHYVILYLKGVTVCKFHDGQSAQSYVGMCDDFWENTAESFLNEIRKNPTSCCSRNHMKYVRSTVAMDWWINGK